MTDTEYLATPRGRLAYRHHPGRGPTIVFLPGYMSDMTGSKASALFAWAMAGGRACLLLDYAGCGASEGDFADGTLDGWREDVLAVAEAAAPGRWLLVGSSMGGWLMLLVALARPDRVAGLVGIAAAPDFTDWGYDAAEKAQLAAGETVHQPSDYGYETMPTYPGFWASGQAHGLLGGAIPLPCPVRLIHGQADRDVPWEISLRLAEALASGDVAVQLIKDGDHRLSRPQDISRLLSVVADLHDQLGHDQLGATAS